MDASDTLRALELMEQCARQLMRTGGMVNKDLAYEVTKFVSEQRASLPKDLPCTGDA